MRPSVRQRIIGLGLLVLLLLILVPWALQVPDKLQLHLDAQLPTPPTIDWQSLTSPIDADSLAQVAGDITHERAESVADGLDDKDSLRAFALALGHYSTRALAVAERQRLNDAGFHAYVRQHDNDVVLYAGPELDRARLTLLQQRLAEDKRFHFDEQKVVTYRP